MIDYVFSLILYCMNAEQVLTFSKQFAFTGLRYQNFASFLLFATFVCFMKFAKIIKTCSTNNKIFPLNMIFTHLRLITLKQTKKHRINATFTNTLLNLASQIQHTFFKDFYVYIAVRTSEIIYF